MNMNIKKSGPSYHTCQHKRREERRVEAAFRQTLRDTRTTAEQLELIADIRPGESAREKARLQVL